MCLHREPVFPLVIMDFISVFEFHILLESKYKAFLYVHFSSNSQFPHALPAASIADGEEQIFDPGFSRLMPRINLVLHFLSNQSEL
jgi:hypothetical protein